VDQDFSSWRFADDQWKSTIQHPGVEQILRIMKENHSICIESYKSVWIRAQRTKEVWKNELTRGNVAIVTHSTFLREFTKTQFEDEGLWLENCECREFRL
jgi:broad specificity phosphatase PhoE